MTTWHRRDPERIDKMIGLLRRVWQRYPDLRLGQMIANAAADDQDVFYIEDDVVEARLVEMLTADGSGPKIKT